MSTSEKTAEKRKWSDRAGDFIESHGLASGIVAALLVFGVFALVFWFTVFSGLSSSADFIYAQF